MTQNPKLTAIVSIRNLVLGLSNDWKELKSLGADIDESIHHTSTIFINKAPVLAHERWLIETSKVEKNVQSLKGIMNRVVESINHKKSDGLAELWDKNKEFATNMLESLNVLNELGKTYLPGDLQSNWTESWNVIFDKFVAIQHLAEGSSLHLSMIDEFAPEEVDELTDTILRNMPKRYTMEEALQYEKEYMQAYEELKKEATQKKNLWDRFLDILAGGVQQSPAERVMMQRWVNGEKGEL
ncbi:MAG: hypothetical protein MI974_03710 [Chitinophagales bacterium]|nr:hypothetical protein [Chitinophagales bacterium]